MVLVFLTRILLTLYGLGLLIMFMRLLGVMATGAKRSVGDVVTIVLFPIYLMTKPGRVRIEAALEQGEK